MAGRKPTTSKPIPEAQEVKNAELTPTETETKVLNETLAIKELPEVNNTQKELPKDYNEENSIKLGDEVREIKSTKLKYHRNNTAVSYKIFQTFPLPDVLSMEKGYLDPNRDGDQILFDFLVAVFDDAEFVKRHYDDMTAADVDRILEIFCRLNGISEREEQAKNRQAKGTKT